MCFCAGDTGRATQYRWRLHTGSGCADRVAADAAPTEAPAGTTGAAAPPRFLARRAPEDVAEGQVDALAHRPRGAWQGVAPVALGRPFHQQQAARFQVQGQTQRRIPAVAQQEAAGGPQAQRGDHRLRTQLRLVIAVPAHGVGATAVAVGQHAVEWPAQFGLQAVAQGRQLRQPGVRLEAAAGIAVHGPGVADPAAQARRGQLASEQADPVHFPRDLAQQARVQGPGLRRRQPATGQAHACLGQVEMLPFHAANLAGRRGGGVHLLRPRRTPRMGFFHQQARSPHDVGHPSQHDCPGGRSRRT